MLFDLYLLQRARLLEQSGTKQSNLIRYSIPRLRESLIADETSEAGDE